MEPKPITRNRKPIEKLPVVRNFRQVIEDRDIHLMKKELYDFLVLYCGFIAHFDIGGFKATYSDPRDFAGSFIRRFDKDHRYFNGVYSCHEEPYKETGYTKAEIKEEFFRIVEKHKDAIARWATQKLRDERYALYLKLKKEFQEEESGIRLDCEACGNSYEVRVLREGQDYTDFGVICCLFCGQQVKLY